jgi:hypothetical protein
MLLVREIIQLNHTNRAKLLEDPNNNSRNEHATYRTCKENGGISDRHHHKVLVHFFQFGARVVEWESNANLYKSMTQMQACEYCQRFNNRIHPLSLSLENLHRTR